MSVLHYLQLAATYSRHIQTLPKGKIHRGRKRSTGQLSPATGPKAHLALPSPRRRRCSVTPLFLQPGIRPHVLGTECKIQAIGKRSSCRQGLPLALTPQDQRKLLKLRISYVHHCLLNIWQIISYYVEASTKKKKKYKKYITAKGIPRHLCEVMHE